MFGTSVRPAETTAAAEWIGAACNGDSWTVGGLVPNDFESYIRIAAPPPCPGDWWPLYRSVFEAVAIVGERHTSTADRAWYAVWEGHGYDNAITRLAWWDPPAHDGERDARADLRERLREEDRQRNAAIRAGLGRFPLFDRPARRYYLMTGPVRAVTELRYPDDLGWRNPDLFWPEDRRWFAATDVDFWSLYVGGPSEFTADLVDAVPTPSEPVHLEFELPIED